MIYKKLYVTVKKHVIDRFGAWLNVYLQAVTADTDEKSLEVILYFPLFSKVLSQATAKLSDISAYHIRG